MAFTFDLHKNLVSTSVLGAPSPALSGTSLTLASGGGALFPSPPFNVVVYPTGIFPTLLNSEIFRVTAVSGDTFTAITRAQEGTSPRSILVGDIISLVVTAKTLTDIESAINTLAATTSTFDASAIISGTLPTLRMPALTGDITTSVGSVLTTLATVNSNVGIFGDLQHIPVITVNAKGLITAVSTQAVSGASFFPDITDAGGIVSGTSLNYVNYIYNNSSLNMTRDLYGNYTLGVTGVRFKENIGWQLYHIPTTSWYTLMNYGSTPQPAFNNNLFNNNFSNVRFIDNLGFQFYNTSTTKWHTLLCISNPAELAFDDGTTTTGSGSNFRFDLVKGMQYHNSTTNLWHTLTTGNTSLPTPTLDAGNV
jgi:hypothetical protein